MVPRRLSLALLTAAAAAVLGSGRSAAAPVGRLAVFVHERNAAADRIFVYRVAEKSGALKKVKGSPFTASSAREVMAVNFNSLSVAYSEPDAMLFSASAKGISVFRVDAALRLAPVAGSPFGAGHIFSVALARKGTQTFVYGPAYFPDGKGIRGFALQPNGSLVELPGSPYEPSGGSFGSPVVVGDVLVAIKAGQFVINNGEVVSFHIQADGSLTAGPRFAYDVDAFHPITARSGACVYLPEINRRRLLAFTLDASTGTLTPAPGSPLAVNSQLAAGLLAMAANEDLALLFDSRPPDAKLHALAAGVNADGTLTARGGVQTLKGVPAMGLIGPSRLSFITASSAEVRTYRLKGAARLLTGRAVKIKAGNIDGIALGRR